MISRLITMLLFTWSVYMAVFGQHIFGREHIVEMASNFGPTMTKQSASFSEETTRFFASIEPSAGEETSGDQLEEQVFTFVLVDSLTSEDVMSFIEADVEYKKALDEEKSS